MLLSTFSYADLSPFGGTFIGPISISVDAEGNNDLEGGVLTVEKPVGGTVRAAFLLANSHNFFRVRTIEDGDVSLLGTPVNWEQSEFNGTSVDDDYFHNRLADVTEIVAPLIDASTELSIQVPVTEVETDDINGTILVVVFDDPNASEETSVTLFFGGQSTQGETFNIALAQPADNLELAQLGLGVGHGAQGQFGTDMVNEITVNGMRLTSSAGGEDDGDTLNGALITVGGVGDDPANPEDPLAPSTGFDTDDELYDLRPFIADGDTEISIFSFNPTDDDNIFFAYFVTSAAAAILPEVPAPLAGELQGAIDPALPTIVLTHGLQPALADGDDSADLWTGNGMTQAQTLIESRLGTSANEVNIVQYVWEEAFQPAELCLGGLPDRDQYIAGQQKVAYSGARLAVLLATALGENYDKPIQFIGHSLGTAVNAHAVNRVVNFLPNTPSIQFTALDRPHHIHGKSKICKLTEEDEAKYGFDENFFASLVPTTHPDIDIRIDNYYSKGVGGVGDRANGDKVYNHPELKNSNDVGGRYFPEESAALGIDNNHSGVHQWYRLSTDPNNSDLTVHNPLNGENCVDAEWRKPLSFNSSLNPCSAGWGYSLLQNPSNPGFSSLPSANGQASELLNIPVAVIDTASFGCNVSADPLLITCTEASSPFVILDVSIDDSATSMSFDYAFTKLGDGDYATVFVDGDVVWTMGVDASPILGEFANSGPIPLARSNGRRNITVALNGIGDSNAELVVRNLVAEAAPAVPSRLVSAVLPSSRSVQVGNPATVFATIINADVDSATACSISLTDEQLGTLTYQATDPLTNSPIGETNTPIDIEAGAAQSFLISLLTNSPLEPQELAFTYVCEDAEPAPLFPALNTLLLSASLNPVPDVVALAATQSADGIVNLQGQNGANAFGVAAVNVGVTGTLTAALETGGVTLPVTFAICATDANAQCLAPPGAEVSLEIAADSTPTFSIFVTGSGIVPFDASVNRAFVRFRDEEGVVRGSTSVALRTTP